MVAKSGEPSFGARGQPNRRRLGARRRCAGRFAAVPRGAHPVAHPVGWAVLPTAPLHAARTFCPVGAALARRVGVCSYCSSLKVAAPPIRKMDRMSLRGLNRSEVCAFSRRIRFLWVGQDAKLGPVLQVGGGGAVVALTNGEPDILCDQERLIPNWCDWRIRLIPINLKRLASPSTYPLHVVLLEQTRCCDWM